MEKCKTWCIPISKTKYHKYFTFSSNINMNISIHGRIFKMFDFFRVIYSFEQFSNFIQFFKNYYKEKNIH